MVFHWQNSGSIRHAVHPHPKIAFLSGTHGNEHGVIPALDTKLKEYAHLLPPFLYVPVISPSALAKKTRRNDKNNDMNRIYYDDSKDEEMQSVMNIFRNQSFNYVFDFHEDPEYDLFYLYDSGIFPKTSWEAFTSDLKNNAIETLTGFDDENEPEQYQQWIENGYIGEPESHQNLVPGTAWEWMLTKNICKRMFTVETPSSFSPEKKLITVDLVFKHIILPLVLQK